MKNLLFLIPLLFWVACEQEESEDCAGVLGGDNICDCTDSTAINYNSEATFDDGSCDYEPSPIYDFVARYINDAIIIRWTSNYDSDFLSFEIEKSEISPESGFEKITEITMNELGYYQQIFDYTDTDIEKDRRYYYRVIKSDSSNNYSESNVVTASSFSKFSFYVHSKDRVYTVDIDGENIEEIVKFEISSSYLWSPDNTKILIRRGSSNRIADYTNYIDWSTIISPFPAETEFYDAIYWSENEDRIFFWDGYDDVSYWVNADGSNLTEFPLPGPYDYLDVNVNTSNDYVVYERYHSSDKGLTVKDPTGNLIWQLTENENLGQHRNPIWSRDGSKIIFNARPAPQTSTYNNLFIINSNGTGVIQKTFYNGNHVDEWGRFLGENVWSYDDRYIYYKLMNSNQIIIKDIDNGTEYNYSGVRFPIWIENNYLVSLEGNDSRELIISNIDGSYQETIVVLPDSLSNPSELHFIPN
jgi:hypothetical protein